MKQNLIRWSVIRTAVFPGGLFTEGPMIENRCSQAPINRAKLNLGAPTHNLLCNYMSECHEQETHVISPLSFLCNWIIVIDVLHCNVVNINVVTTIYTSFIYMSCGNYHMIIMNVLLFGDGI